MSKFIRGNQLEKCIREEETSIKKKKIKNKNLKDFEYQDPRTIRKN
jgi:hypothetical protein